MKNLPALPVVSIPDTASAVDAAPIAAWNESVNAVRDQYERGLALCEVAGRRAVAEEGLVRESVRQHSQGRELMMDAAMQFVRFAAKRPEIVAYAWTLSKAPVATAEHVAAGILADLRRNTLWPDRSPDFLEWEEKAKSLRAAASQPQAPLLPEHLQAVEAIKDQLRAMLRVPFSAENDTCARESGTLASPRDGSLTQNHGPRRRATGHSDTGKGQPSVRKTRARRAKR